jgi:hypothetical protein
VNGNPAIVVCNGSLPSAMHAHHHHPGADHRAPHEGAHGDPPCPYAQSAGAAPLPVLSMRIVGTVPIELAAPPAFAQTFAPSGPLRTHRTRGPPHLA